MNKSYLEFSTEDFIADEAFQQWVSNPTMEANQLWQSWLHEHPGKARQVHEASVFINHLSITSTFPSEQKIEASLSKTLLEIESMEGQTITERPRFRRRNMHLSLTAISIVAVALLYVFVFRATQKVSIQEFTAGTSIKKILLPDSTEITLNKHSSIKYLSNLANSSTREVWLDGEAYFDVRHIEKNGSAQKFIVNVNEMKIEVLGTTFNIKKRDNIYNVTLNSGKINISLKNDASTLVTLAPGEFLQYAANEKKFIRKKVQSELYSDWKRERMLLDNTPLSEIAALIHDIYGYNTIIKHKAIEQEKVSGTIMLTDEQTMLKALAFALNLTITKSNNDLIFELKQKTR